MPNTPPTPPSGTTAKDDPDQRLQAERAGATQEQYTGSAPLAPLKTVTTTDRYQNEVEVQAGIDGQTPISPQNPSPRAVSNPDADYFKEPPPNEA